MENLFHKKLRVMALTCQKRMFLSILVVGVFFEPSCEKNWYSDLQKQILSILSILSIQTVYCHQNAQNRYKKLQLYIPRLNILGHFEIIF